MRTSNLLVILSDEHARGVTGCYGNSLVRTPHLDGLAARGTCFDAAYTPSPVCVSARAALATGREVHEIGAWDSARPYYGEHPSWAHRLRGAGHSVASVGKLHYRASTDDNGFAPELLPMHVDRGEGWVLGLLRKPSPVYPGCKKFARDVGEGESSYTHYDREIADAASRWLRERAVKDEGPWALFVSFVSPHYPLRAPAEFFSLYDPRDIPWPKAYDPSLRPSHPVVQGIARSFNYDAYFDEERVKVARAAYYGLTSFLDHSVGEVLGTLAECGLEEGTRIIYTTDHGEMLGNFGLWTKMVMYEESVAIPMILAGPDIPAGHRVKQPVSLVDIYPTVLQCAGVDLDGEEERSGGGESLFETLGFASDQRCVLSQYHDGGADTGCFMLRWRNWKYVHYVHQPPQLFDLESDPEELNDLGGDLASNPRARAACDELEAKLRRRLDPEAVNEAAFADQAVRLEALGGEAAVRARGDFGHTPAPISATAMSDLTPPRHEFVRS